MPAELGTAATRVGAHPLVAAVVAVLRAEPVCAVGGVVRDALLGVEPGDEVDLVVEGDVVAFAHDLADRLRAPRLDVFPRFLTAEITLAIGRVDLVGARREHYPAPGALPEVRPGTLDDDLRRRDFTVNAMAVGLSGPRAGMLIDPHGGLEDLDRRLLCTLRTGAFHEDPSRLVRGARYVGRLDMSFAPSVLHEAGEVARALDLGAARVADEMIRLFEEQTAGAAFAELQQRGVPWAREGARERIAAIDRALASGGAPPLPRWALRAGTAVDPGVLAGSAFPGWARTIASQMGDGPQLVARLGGARRPSQVDAILRRAAPAAAVQALALGAGAVVGWWAHDRDRTLAITGDDLKAAGVAVGPAIGRGLMAARAAMLDGRAPTREAQLSRAIEATKEGEGA